VTRLAGFGGHLLAQSFVASVGWPALPDAAREAQRSWLTSHEGNTRQLGPASTTRVIFESSVLPLLEALGFERIDNIRFVGSALAATARAQSGVAAVVVAPWSDRLDAYWQPGVEAATRCGARWCLLFNGTDVRIVSGVRLYSRRFAAIDLTAAAEQEEMRALLWRLASARVVCANTSHDLSLDALVAASDRFAAAVCRSLRRGVLAASAEVLSALIARDRNARQASVDAAFEQALTIVYRVLFLLFAEARSLVPIWHAVYRESYSIESIRDLAERPGGSAGLWDSLRAIARLAHTGCRAGDLLVRPFNGRLFSPTRTPLAERRDLDDRAAQRALLALTTRATRDGAGRERIVYRDLGVEELGGVYETLLDYQPSLDTPSSSDRRPRPIARLEAGSGTRKATGTFYTPRPLAEYLVRRTLAPLVRHASPDEILALRVLDMSMGSGAFLVAVCRFLAAAYEHAIVTSGECQANDIDDAQRALFRQRVAERCLYGVDVNPMAVQLARLSLWLATLSAGRPLSFLDHRLVTGDSLLGTWLSHLRRPPANRRRFTVSALPLFEDQITEGALGNALPMRFSLESMPNDTLEQVRAKEHAFSTIAADGRLALWKRVANLWCSNWFTTGDVAVARLFRTLADDTVSGTRTLASADALLSRADDAADAHGFLHWELEFPEVFFDRNGRRLARPGFDAVVGNPPWDMLRADNGSRHSRAGDRQRVSSTTRFTRDSGVYSAQSDGHANCYQLFLERTVDLTRTGGRFGLVLPSGLATDAGSAPLRRLLFARSSVDGLIGLDNVRRIFPIHRSVRFLLLTATAGASTTQLPCRFGLESTSTLEIIGDDVDRAAFPVQLSTTTLERLSGDSLAIPYLRSQKDLVIAERAASLFSALGSERGWNVRFGRELNATDDRDAFRTSPPGVPVIDGKHLVPFRVDVTRSTRRIRFADLRRRMDPERISRSRLGYRDVASATNRVTIVAAILPAGCVSTHTVFCLRTPLPLADQQLLCGLFNSLVVNYLARLRVATHVTTAIVEGLAVPTRDSAPAACRSVAMLSRRLSRRHDLRDWASLNAHVARLYQLTPDEFAHVLDTFPLIDRGDRDAAMAAFVAGFRDGD
jgi:hypothetical protein